MIRNATGNSSLGIRALVRVVMLVALGWAMSLVLVAPARADVSVFAEAHPASVAVGESFQLEVRVRSTGLGGAGKLIIPASPNLQQTGHASSETMSLINGAANRERIEVFTYVARQAGRYTFQGLGVRNGDTFIAGPVVSVSVGAAAPPPPPQAAPPPGAIAEPNIELPPEGEDVFATANVSSRNVKVGEPVTYTFRFYFRINPDQPTYDGPDFSGFQTYDLGQNKESQTMVIRGQTYGYFELKTLLYPLRSGDLTISPATLTFRSSFFFSRQSRTQSKAIVVHVEPLPDAAPAGFQGAVGKFTLRSSTLPRSAPLNEPVSVHLTVAGMGNFNMVNAPDAVSTGTWRLYPGRVSNDVRPTEAGLQGAKTFEVLLQPPEMGRMAAPKFRFVYYDAKEERYVSLVTSPGETQVTGDLAAAARQDRSPMLTLRPVRVDLGDPIPSPERPWNLFFWLLPVPLVGLVLLSAGRAVNRRFRTVTDADRLLSVRRKWERQLEAAGMSAPDLLKAMDEWLHATRGLSVAPTEEEIRQSLGGQAEELLTLRRSLEGAVFGGGQADVRGIQRKLREWTKASGLLFLALALGGLLGSAALNGLADGESAQTLFAKGQAAQMKGDFNEALRLYNRTVERAGLRVNLLYNLAGAAWRAGQPALARYAIETAYAFAPRDGDVSANRDLIGEAVAKQGGSRTPAASGKITYFETGWAAVALYGLFTLALLAGWFVRPLRWMAGFLLVLCLPVWGYAAYLVRGEDREPPGLTWTAVSLHEAAGDTSAEVAPLPAGEIGRVLDKSGPWLKIRTGNGLTGWIHSESWRRLELLSPGQDIPE